MWVFTNQKSGLDAHSWSDLASLCWRWLEIYVDVWCQAQLANLTLSPTHTLTHTSWTCPRTWLLWRENLKRSSLSCWLFTNLVLIYVIQDKQLHSVALSALMSFCIQLAVHFLGLGSRWQHWCQGSTTLVTRCWLVVQRIAVCCWPMCDNLLYHL